VSVSAFGDAGNLWRDPLEVNPTTLFRGAGVGIQLVTPFGPMGLDYAYGFDKPSQGGNSTSSSDRECKLMFRKVRWHDEAFCRSTLALLVLSAAAAGAVSAQQG
jgi:hypothetical protein